MIKKTIKRNQDSKRIWFCVHKKTSCPVCSSKMFWDEDIKTFRCSNKDCDFIILKNQAKNEEIFETSRIVEIDT